MGINRNVDVILDFLKFVERQKPKATSQKSPLKVRAVPVLAVWDSYLSGR